MKQQKIKMLEMLTVCQPGPARLMMSEHQRTGHVAGKSSHPLGEPCTVTTRGRSLSGEKCVSTSPRTRYELGDESSPVCSKICSKVKVIETSKVLEASEVCQKNISIQHFSSNLTCPSLLLAAHDSFPQLS